MSGGAVLEFHRLIESDPSLMRASREYLLEQFAAVNLVFGGRTLSPYMRPHFLSPEEWNRTTEACETVWSAIEKVGCVAPGDPFMQEQLGLTRRELELVAIDPGYSDVSVTSRLDSFLTADSLHFVELNAECPAGIAYAEVATDIFLGMPAMKRFQETHRVTPLKCRKRMLDALLSTYRRARGRDHWPTIAIVDYGGQPTQREFELFGEFFERAGHRTTIADPRELELREGSLFHGNFKIDIVYRRVLTTELLEKEDACRALVEAYEIGAAVFVNSFRTKFVHKKMLFGVLTDERHRSLFSEEERRAISEHVPWTRRLEDSRTSHGGVDIVLLEFVRSNRTRLVLKPNDDYGGHGIFMGWELAQGEWESAIETSLKGDYLVQERVRTSREVFPFMNGGESEIRMIEQLVDLDPLLFFGKVHGAFTRLSSSSLANVTSGAGMVPTMIVE